MLSQFGPCFKNSDVHVCSVQLHYTLLLYNVAQCTYHGIGIEIFVLEWFWNVPLFMWVMSNFAIKDYDYFDINWTLTTIIQLGALTYPKWTIWWYSWDFDGLF